MKKSLTKKLTLNKQTVRTLNTQELRNAAGGVTPDGCGTNTCDTCLVHNCQLSGNCVTTGLTTIVLAY